MNARDQWLFSQQLKSQQLLLLLCYDAHVNGNGDRACFPSFSTVAAECKLARRYVIDTTHKVLCAPGGPMSVVTDPAERAAIFAKVGIKRNLRVNVYRLNYSDGAWRAPSEARDSASHAPSAKPNGASGALSDADKEAELLALARSVDAKHGLNGAPDAPSDSAHGAPSASGMVHVKAPDGAPDDTGMVHGVHPNLKTEPSNEPSRARGGARAREASSVARTLTGAPAAARASEPTDEEGLPERGATIAGALRDALDSAPPKAPLLGGGPVPANALRPPDPFDDAGETKAWLSRSLGRAAALAVARPKAIYAPVADLAAARADLARRAAERAAMT